MMTTQKTEWTTRGRSFLFVFFSVLVFAAVPLSAQTPRIIHHTVTKLQKENTYLGRDLWFTMCKNADNQTGKYYYLYISSPKNTIANIHIPGLTDVTVPISAGIVYTQNIDLSAEVTSSGVVENKAIHVWSNDADLTAYLLSRNPGSTDGMLIIPTTGWGTEYVVAGYESLYQGYGSYVYDYPSEFSIVANQDNTICKIIPNSDIRAAYEPQTILHKAGQPFTEVLNRGQCVQYMTTLASDPDNFDVTGTIITSNNPVGVIGASQCANIPVDYLYCNHVCDMIPPVRTWARTYQTVPFAQRQGGDTYLVIGTKPGQIIYRDSNQYAVLGNKYSFYFRPDINQASTWTSTDPFLLVQYINGSTWEAEYGSNVNLVGDPSMVVINSVEQYVSHIIFQTPSITNAFQNFVNLMVNNKALNGTTLDGKSINSYPYSSSQPVPFSNYTAFRIGSVQPGTHIVNSDSGVGVYIYGYGKEDAYAWSGALGLRTFNDPDTVSPMTTITGDCFNAFVTVTDSQISPPSSKISEMKLDTIYNMSYTPDPNYQIGIATESTFYSMNVIDSTKEAYLQIEIHDYAGNKTIVTSTYTPQSATIAPQVLNFGSGTVGVTLCKNFIISNTGNIPFTWQSINLLLGNKGFAIGSLGDSSAIPVGSSRNILVCFTPNSQSPAYDTLVFSDGCVTIKSVMLGTGGGDDFNAGNEDFGCQLVGTTTIRSDAVISNLSKILITIDTITLDDSHFALVTPVSSTQPLSILPEQQITVEFSFRPDQVKQFPSHAHFHCPELGKPPDGLWKTDILHGCGLVASAEILKDIDTTSLCGTAVPFSFTVVSTGSAETTIDTIVIAGDSEFKLPLLPYTTPNGKPISMPVILGPGEEFTIGLNFIPPPKSSGTFKSNLLAISARGDTTNIITATVNAIYREIKIKKDTVIIPIQSYGSPPVSDLLEYCNNRDDPVTIDSVTSIPGIFSKAFNIAGYVVNGMNHIPPFQLRKGECLDISIQFDPSVYPDSAQSASFALSTDACSSVPAGIAKSGVKLSVPVIQGFTMTSPILSCDTKTGVVTISNANLPGSSAINITDITVQGPDSESFQAQKPTSTTIEGGNAIQIPVIFSPLPLVPLHIYNDTIVVTLRDPANKLLTLLAPVSASASGMNVLVSSVFAVQSASPDIQTTLTLPIDISFTKNGLPDPVDVFGITKIKLQYQYNTSLLEPIGESIATAYQSANGWIADNASAINDAAGTLTLILTNTSPLTDAMTSLGAINFFPTLAKSGIKTTPISLISSDLFAGADIPVGNCLGVSQKGTEFSIVYTCGDSLLADYLKNGTVSSMVKAPSPNPVSLSTDGTITFKYLTRYEGVISLLLYDELGRVAGRIIDGLYHQAGTYQTQFNIKGLATGSYIYRFQIDGHHPLSGRIIIEN
jgi:hypothetical protein